MKYTYQLIKPRCYKLKMLDSISGKERYLTFELKKSADKNIDVEFSCHDFRINFPLKKNVEHFTFELYNFKLMLVHGIKVHESSSVTTPDLEVEF